MFLEHAYELATYRLHKEFITSKLRYEYVVELRFRVYTKTFLWSEKIADVKIDITHAHGNFICHTINFLL